LPTAHSRADKARSPGEAGIFLDLADQVLDRFQPYVLLTYGGHPASLELMRRARARGIAVVFHLHNFGYTDAGQRRIRVHDPRPLHAGLSFNSDTARSRPMGRHDRAPPGRPPVRGPPLRCCQDRGDALGSGAGGRILPAAFWAGRERRPEGATNHQPQSDFVRNSAPNPRWVPGRSSPINRFKPIFKTK
jgi:hypothetical protein